MNKDIRNYALVTGAYWGFTLTDGALRMLVLLYFHSLGYSPLQLASLFLLYEIAGVITNLMGGFIASRMGLNITLYLGLSLQVAALIMLSFLNPAWDISLAVTWVLLAQGLSGVAKDFTKMSAKSAIKILVPKGQHSALFKWVSLLTGSKNTLKGIGFFLGGALLSVFGFNQSLWMMAAGLGVIFCASLIFLPRQMGRAKDKSKFKDILSKNSAINRLSFARMFLFGARDVWFVVGLPLYMKDVLGFSFTQTGGYMALWVMAYGVVQALTPRLIAPRQSSTSGEAKPRNAQTGGAKIERAKTGSFQTNESQSGDGITSEIRASRLWVCILSLLPLMILGGLYFSILPDLWMVLGGLAVFGFVFAINSALHSYLILAFTDQENVSLDVGFYYMANASGRLMGTILSGLAYGFGGFNACLAVSSILLLIAAVASFIIPTPKY